jgi:hypothetical protein
MNGPSRFGGARHYARAERRRLCRFRGGVGD